MYDALQFRYDLPPGPAAERALANAPAMAAAELMPATDGPGGPHLRAHYRGQRLDYWPELRRLRLRGSLHSFAYGHNACQFAPADVGLACRELAGAVGVPPELLTVHRLEAGLNLATPGPPRQLLESLLHHKSCPFLAMIPPARGPRPLELVAFHTDFRLKAYEKSTYARLKRGIGPTWPPLPGLLADFREQYAPAREGLLTQAGPLPPFALATQPAHLLRLELVYLRARALELPGLPAPLTLAHLADPATAVIFAQQLLQRWSQVQYRTPMEFPPNLTPNEAALLLAGAMPDYWEAIRPNTAPATYKRARARFNELKAAQSQLSGPPPLLSLLEAGLVPWLAPATADADKC